MMDTKRPRPDAVCPPSDPRAWVAGDVDELTIAFGSLLLREPELVDALLVLDDLFVDDPAG